MAAQHRLIRRRQRALVRRFGVGPGPARTGIAQPDLVDHHDVCRRFWVGRSEARRDHAPHRVPYDRGPIDPQFIEKSLRVPCRHVEVVVDQRFRRSPVPEPIDREHAEPRLRQRGDRGLERRGEEVHSVEEHYGASVRLPDRRYVHVRHPVVLAIQTHAQEAHRVGIRHVAVVDRGRSPVGGRFSRRRTLRAERGCDGGEYQCGCDDDVSRSHG